MGRTHKLTFRIAVPIAVAWSALLVGAIALSHASATAVQTVKVWGEGLNISQNAGSSAWPSILVDNGGVAHVWWHDNSEYPYTESALYYRERDVTGLWSTTSVIPNSSESSIAGTGASLDVSGTLHLSWRTQHSEIVYTAKVPGMDWTTPLTISTDNAQGNPILKSDSQGNVFFMWARSTTIMFAERMANGDWLAPTQIFTDISSSLAWDFVLGTDGTVHAVTAGNANYDVYYAKRLPNGTWLPSMQVSDNPTESSQPRVALESDGTPHIVWRDISGPSHYDIFSSVLVSGAWQLAENVSQTFTDASNPQILIGGDGRVHVIWTSGSCHYVQKPTPDGSWSFAYVRPGNLFCRLYLGDDESVQWLSAGGDQINAAWRSGASDWTSSTMVSTFGYFQSASATIDSAGNAYAVWAAESDDPQNDEVAFASLYTTTLTAFWPITLPSTMTTQIDITGTNFLRTPRIYLGSTELMTVTYDAPNHLIAELQAGMEPGDYVMTVVNPDGVSNTGLITAHVVSPFHRLMLPLVVR